MTMTEEQENIILAAGQQLGHDIEEALRRFAEALEPARESLEELARQMEEMEELAQLPPPVEIKKRLKYAKNPMEIRQLNKQLTASYKAYGRRNRHE